MNTEREQDLDLMSRYLAGAATQDDVHALEQRLKADAAMRREFFSHANVDAALQAFVKPALSVEALSADPPKPKATRWRTTAAWMAAAAVLMAGFVVTFRSAPGVEARVMAVSGLKAATWPVGSSQRLHDLDLSEGTLQLGLSNGVVLDLIAPVRLRFQDAMHAALLAGSVTADVGPAGSGFTIDTPSARVVDLGTRFGVDVGREGDTDVAVFKGKVEVHDPRRDQKTSQLAVLNEGDSVRVSSQALVRRQVLIATRGDSAPVLAPPPPDALVTALSDNIDDENVRSFYTIQHGAMKPGARPYSTLGRPRWLAVEGDAFPEELKGADVIGTFSADRHERDLQLTLSVSRACTVYVMFDTRSEVPGWARRDFTEAGFTLRSGPWADNPVVQGLTAGENGEIHVTYSIWKKAVPAAGDVVLGPPYPADNPRHRAMYGIAVK